MIREKIRAIITAALQKLGMEAADFSVEHPADLAHGDYSTNAALVLAKKIKENPKKLAEKIVVEIGKDLPIEVEKIDVAGAGFINFHLSLKFFEESIAEILSQRENFGGNDSLSGTKVMVEYTDPNPFKEFHIGHLMSNAIGESIARLSEFGGAKVVRACWQGDVGLHVAKAIWGMKKEIQDSGLKIQELRSEDWGRSYTSGAQSYEADENTKKEINELNKEVFDRSDPEVNKFYDQGRQTSLDHFEVIYKKLGTKFDHYFFEGTEGRLGVPIVEEFLKKGVFEKSDGAVVYKGEKAGLHTRVFITSQGLPTYETKELGLNKTKFEKEPDLDQSIIVTANEQDDYFKVVFAAMKEIFPKIASKTKHISHGMMRFASGKMSSRTGNVITGESLIKAVEGLVAEKIKDRELPEEEKQKIISAVAVGAIKYSILKQATGGDIVYDFDRSISFEGDSGPYLQYSYARAKSVLCKAGEDSRMGKGEPNELARLLYRFPEVVERALSEYEPHYIATYLTGLAAEFNSFYANNPILDAGEATPGRLALTESFTIVMKNGLWLLGIQAPEKM